MALLTCMHTSNPPCPPSHPRAWNVPLSKPSASRDQQEEYTGSWSPFGRPRAGTGPVMRLPRLQGEKKTTAMHEILWLQRRNLGWFVYIVLLAQHIGIVQIKQTNGAFGLELKRLLAFFCFYPPLPPQLVLPLLLGLEAREFFNSSLSLSPPTLASPTTSVF